MYFNLFVNKQTISCKELSVFLYKDLLKCTYGDEPDILSFISFVNNLLSELTSKPVSFFESLSIVDIMSCLFQVRINSLGDKTNISLNSESSKKTVGLRLDWINEELLSFYSEKIDKTIQLGQIKINLGAPCIQRLLEPIDEEYLYFIKSIEINEKILIPETNLEAQNICEKLPIKVIIAVIDHFEIMIDEIKKLNFLQRYKISEPILGFIPSLDSLLWFTKLIFNESLQALYDNIFYLAKLANIPPSYTESISVGEYFVHTSALQRSLAQQNRTSQDSSLSNEAINDLPDQI